MKKKSRQVKVRAEVVFREEDEGAFLFDPDNGRLCYLNAIGIDIWKMCQRCLAEDDIVEALVESYSGAPPQQIASDCAAFLDELDRLGFTEHREQDELHHGQS